MDDWFAKARAELRTLDPTTKISKLTEAEFKWEPAVGDMTEPHAGAAWKATTL